MFKWYKDAIHIPGNTFQASKTNNLSVPVITDRPIESRSVFGLSLMLANTMSLAPKIDEVRSTILDFKPNLGFITETWLRDTIGGVADYRPEPLRRYSKILHLVRFDFHGT